MTCSDFIGSRRRGKLPHDHLIQRGKPVRYSRSTDTFETIVVTKPGDWCWQSISRQEARWLAREEWPLIDLIEPYDQLPPKYVVTAAGVEWLRGRTPVLVARSLNEWLRRQGIPARGDLLPREARAA
jgi:hypothetical protein